MPKMQTSFKGLVHLLARNLYTSPDVFIRELLQNAHDGCQRALAAGGQIPPRIEITTSESDRTIAFADNGIGMDEKDIREYLSTIGQSGTASESERLAETGQTLETIGQFGVGLLSAFVVAERIDVFTRKQAAGTAYHWMSQGGDEYQLAPTHEMTDYGTEIVLTLRPEFAHFLREKELLKAVKLFADFLMVPICLNGKGPVNRGDGPWHQAEWLSEAGRREAYAQFIQSRYGEQPLLIIPFHHAQPRAHGVLYITSLPIPGIGVSGVIDVYVRRMCVRLGDGELLPEWATFVRGLVDADLQPTASRDNLQRDANYHQLRQALGRAVIEALLELQQIDPDCFNRLCTWHHVGIKGMALRDDSFLAAVAEQLPFATNEGTLSLAEYLRRQPPAGNGRRPIYFFASSGDEAQFYRVCSANSLLAINAGQIFDEEILAKYAAAHPQTVELQPLNRLDSKRIYAEPAPAKLDACAPLLRSLNEQLKKEGLAHVCPQMREFAPESAAAVLLDGPGSASVERFDALLQSPFVPAGFRNVAEEFRNRLQEAPVELLLNLRNPLVQALRDFPQIEESQGQALAKGLYQLALLNSRRRLKPETAQHADRYLQERMLEVMQLQAALERRAASPAPPAQPAQAAASPNPDTQAQPRREAA
jgi:molecular chaperone HtpG